MKKIFGLLLLLSQTAIVTAQLRDPEFSSAISIEHSYIPGIFIYGAFIPDNLEFTERVSNKFYLQGGVFAQNADEVPGETFFKTGFALYGGTTVKFLLFRRCYFTPSLNLYYDNYKDDVLYNGSLTLGPTAAFEYFISNRFSLRLDVLNVNAGIGFPNGDIIFTLHRFIGIGARYNFNFRKLK